MSAARPEFRLPWRLVALDGVGTLLLVLGILGGVGVDTGLPFIAEAWPFLAALGTALMAPLILWVIRQARKS